MLRETNGEKRKTKNGTSAALSFFAFRFSFFAPLALRFFAFRLSLFVLPVLTLTGCEVLGVAAYKIAGPPAVEAKYIPDKEKPMLVLVENYQHQTAGAATADVLAHYLADDLESHRIAPIIPFKKLQSLRDAKPADYPTMPITAIGKETGAQQVLYVQLHSSDVTPLAGGEAFTGQSAATVKVVDVATGQTLWPTDIAAGYSVAASTRLGEAGAQTPQDVRQRLNHQLTDEISRLFRKWKPDDLSEGEG